MAWTTPLTAVAGAQLAAAQWNASVRDNLNATCTGLATAAGYIPVSTGTNAVAMRQVKGATVSTSSTTSSTAYTNLAATVGPTVTVTTGTQALVWIAAGMSTDTTNAAILASCVVSGASSIAADDTFSITLDGVVANNTMRYGSAHLFTLTAGSNVFTMVYRTGSGATVGTFGQREIIVLPL